MRALSTLGLAVMLACLCVSPVGAVPYTALNGETYELDYWAGSGANEAVIVVDFNQGPSDVYAFGYRWDGVADGGKALTAIVAEGALDAGLVVYNWPLPTDEKLFVTSFTYAGVTLDNTVTSPFSPSWAYWVDDVAGPGELVEWAYSAVGMSDHVLQHGGAEGFVYSYDLYPNIVTSPRQPPAAGQGEIPEPTCLMLLAAGVAGLVARRRRRR
ncbi:MAG: PEP-CTERM sorting domain-containing protein [Candidatus Brocadiae bacterium]|nr:PEP-CTERM sorting domain-containing protein [Candidatus Brocadiia bacterium]